MITAWNDAEEQALQGLPWLAQVIYLRGIRRFMDYRTGLAGSVRGISYQSLREVAYVEPVPGRHAGAHGLPSLAEVRNAVKLLIREGLLVRIGPSDRLVFHCVLASVDQSAQKSSDRGTTDPSNRRSDTGKVIPYRQLGDSSNSRSNRGSPPSSDTPPVSGDKDISPYGDMFGATPNRAKQVQQKSRQQRDTAREVLAFLNERAGRAFPETEANIGLIVARLREGYSADQLRQVVVRKTRQWGGDAKMAQYLRPKTLFGRTNFANYVGELVTGNAGRRQG